MTFSATNIEVRLATDRKSPPPDAKLGFGNYFAEHMFIAEWDSKGWSHARIVPYGPISVEPAAAVLHYAQALIDGLKAVRGADAKIRLFRAARHCARFCASLPRLALPPVDSGELQSIIRRLVELDQHWVPNGIGTSLYIRPTVIATESYIGVRESTKHIMVIISCPVAPYFSESMKPIRVWIERIHVRAPRWGIGDVKAAANYPATLMTARKCRLEGFDQVLWLDGEHRQLLQELGNMNVFVRIGEEVITPALDGGILPGITRESILQILQDWNVPVTERDITVAELLSAYHRGKLKEVFGCGTAAVVAPVGLLAVDSERLELRDLRDESIARRLYEEIISLQRGERIDRHCWLSAL